jgi:hypothetical protein
VTADGAEIAASTKDRMPRFAVLPYTVDDLVYVLLVKPDAGQGWRLPMAPTLRTGERHVSAATAAWRQFGISGRVHKSPVRSDGDHGRINIFPLLVSKPTPNLAHASVAARWLSLAEAAALIDDHFAPALEAFALRIDKTCRELGPPADIRPKPRLAARGQG